MQISVTGFTYQQVLFLSFFFLNQCAGGIGCAGHFLRLQ